MYPTVPTTAPSIVSSVVFTAGRATPKSTILIASTDPPASITFPGLTSRWTIPAACAAASARAIPSPQRAVSSTESAACPIRSRSEGPSIHSIARYASSSFAPSPCATYRTIPGCESPASTEISRSNRAALSPPPRARIFTATGSPVARSSAL